MYLLWIEDGGYLWPGPLARLVVGAGSSLSVLDSVAWVKEVSKVPAVALGWCGGRGLLLHPGLHQRLGPATRVN